jgi:putative DNA methylase
MTPPRVLIEEWLPAAAIGVECMREENSPTAKPPTKYFHVWWARRPLTISRAAVLASLLPTDFPHDVFERLIGFARPGRELVEIARLMDAGFQIPGGFGCGRAFKQTLRYEDLDFAHEATRRLWTDDATVLDPMSGGGSIPFEALRLGFRVSANEYNPVACTILEATIDFPFRFGEELAAKAEHWVEVWGRRAEERLNPYYPSHRFAKVHAYIFSRTVPAPNTPHPETPLVSDWHLLKPKSGKGIVAEPIIDWKDQTWSVRIRELGTGDGQLGTPPQPTYHDGKGVSLFDRTQLIPSEYIQAKAQAGQMGTALYAVALKTPQGLEFHAPGDLDLAAITEAQKELQRLRPEWEKYGIIPTERIPEGDKTGSKSGKGTDLPLKRGEEFWTDLFTSRQLLCLGVLVEELRRLRSDIVRSEGQERGDAIMTLLAMALDKFLNHNGNETRWENTRGVVKGKMDRHDYAFKSTFAELAPCSAGSGLAWAAENTLKAYRELCRLPKNDHRVLLQLSMGSATNLPQIDSRSITAVVVDPPYADNVQYSELADFFYVWLKRTVGIHRPEWFSTKLCKSDQEAVVNISRHRGGEKQTKVAKAKAQAYYERLMSEAFTECCRVLRDDGVLTVMFTHKKQEAWISLFTSLIQSGFSITATWPVKTESEHSLSQARKNSAQSTVVLVARKRGMKGGTGFFGPQMRSEIRARARGSAERLRDEGLNAIDQLVGSFGPAMEVYSRYDEVRMDTGEPVGVERAIEEASDAVSQWRIEQLAERGLEGVEAEGRFALLCWDVMGAAEFRFNEARLLGHAAGMDVDRLISVGLVTKEGDKIFMVSAKDRRRQEPLKREEIEADLFGSVPHKKRRSKTAALRIHPNDPSFRTTIDACHALALRYLEAGVGNAGIGSAKALVRQQGWTSESNVARLMDALTKATPKALRREDGKNSPAAKFPEFRAWYALLEPLFGLTPPDWSEAPLPQASFSFAASEEGELLETAEEETEEEEEE